MKAYCLIRNQPLYRREAFVEGLKATGYSVELRAPSTFQPGDVLVIWNRYADNHHLANRVEGAGGTVIVAENGYLDPGRHTDRRWYALAVGGHNGQGVWPDGGPERWERIAPQLGVTLAPWRASSGNEGEHVLVCPNRSFGRPGYIMPADWADRTARELRKFTKRPIRIRLHPGNDKPSVPLDRDLENCWAVVIWSSSAGVHALVEGIPVICTAPAWICLGAAERRFDGVDALRDSRFPIPDSRVLAFQRLAWAQWHVEEIACGEPFRHLLPAARQSESAAAV